MIEPKHVKVYLRVLPMEKMHWDYVKILNDHKTVYIRCLQELVKSRAHLTPTFWTFQTDYVFFNHTQQQLYDSIKEDLLYNVANGRDTIVTAYGQTGTGKSVTISGMQCLYKDRGILPRIIPDLFSLMQTKTTHGNTKMCIQISFVEISRTTIVDLLQPYPNWIPSLKDITKRRVESADEILTCIFKGEGRKEHCSKAPYPSHINTSVFTYHIALKDRLHEGAVRKCKLHIIDLAGADTVGNLSCLFKNPRDVGSGNLTKTQLEQFFLVLCSNIPERIRISSRSNFLLQYLSNSLNDKTIMRFFGHIQVSRKDLAVTISMLRFGALIAGLKAFKYQISVDTEVTAEKLKRLQREIAKMQMENKYNSLLMNQDLTRSLSAERFIHIQTTVNEYLHDKIPELSLLNVCDATLALEVLKGLVQKCEEEKRKALPQLSEKIVSSASRPVSKVSRGSKSSSNSLLKKIADNREHVGKLLSANVMPTKSETDKEYEHVPKTKSKSSSSSVLRRSSSNKRASQTSEKLREGKIRSRSDTGSIMMEMPTDSDEVWNVYINEKNEEYTHCVKMYEENEALAKKTFKLYLQQMEELRDIMERVDKHKHELFLAKMTREFKAANGTNVKNETNTTEFDECAQKHLQKAQQEFVEKQEKVLSLQGELKIYINTCKATKKELGNNFDKFCEEKYKMPFTNSKELDEMDIEEFLNKQDADEVENEDLPTVDSEERRYEELKNLIIAEKRKKKLYKLRNKEWVTY